MVKISQLLTIFIATTTIINLETSENFGSNSELKFLSDDGIYTTPSDTATDFDSYVFSLQLPKPQCFLYSQNKCEAKLESVPKNTFTIHGLWPNLGGKQKEDCNLGNIIPVEFKDKSVETKAETIWKSFKDDNESFWNHEFNKHGYCWNLKYGKTETQDFFKFVMELYDKLEFGSIIHRAGFSFKQDEQSFSYTELKEQLTKAIDMNFDIKCLRHEGKQYLNDIFVNLDLNYESLDGNIGTNCSKHDEIIVLFN
jgi:ribonuclease I